MVEVLVIADGAAQPLRDGVPTALQAAAMPVLGSLAAHGAVLRVTTTPPGLPAGSETGIPALLGAPQRSPIGRGWVDAAAYGVHVPEGMTPWRADLRYRGGRRASIRQARDVCAHLGPDAHAVSGHRLVLVARERPADRRLLGLQVSVWEGGAAPTGELPAATVVVCARGAAAGCALLLGARVVVPAGATGDVDTNLHAKAAAAVDAMSSGAERVVVHVGGPDEAAHRRDPAAVVAILERIDAELLAPLRDAVGSLRGRLAVCPDHGTDPATGRHDAAPVPAVVWGEGVAPEGPGELDERAVHGARVVAAEDLFAAPVRIAVGAVAGPATIGGMA